MSKLSTSIDVNKRHNKMLKVNFLKIYFKGGVTERVRKTQRGLPSPSSLPEWSPCKAPAPSQEFGFRLYNV